MRSREHIIGPFSPNQHNFMYAIIEVTSGYNETPMGRPSFVYDDYDEEEIDF